MGTRGPAPTPTVILERRGSWRAKSRPNEPKPELGKPCCPAWLSKPAKAVWKQLVPQLVAMGVLAKIDQHAVARYCTLFVRWRAATEFLDKHGTTYPLKDERGNLRCFMPFPQVAEVNKLAVLMLRLEQEFGLTPSSRTRIQVTLPEKKESKDKTRFFKIA